MIDEKYVVFKRSEWDDEDIEAVEVQDAVVIRTQDIFAGPALHAYASSVQTALEILHAENIVLGGDLVSRMNQVRDHFFEAALQADDHRTKKVPD